MLFEERGTKFTKELKKMFFYYKLSKKYEKNFILKRIFLKLAWIKHDSIFYRFACDITPSSNLKNVTFRHPVGIVIGGGANLGDNVIIHQNVTLGALKFDENRRGISCKQIIGNNTIICAGAKILGDVVIGENCIIGANSIVTIDVPNGKKVVGYNKILN